MQQKLTNTIIALSVGMFAMAVVLATLTYLSLSRDAALFDRVAKLEERLERQQIAKIEQQSEALSSAPVVEPEQPASLPLPPLQQPDAVQAALGRRSSPLAEELTRLARQLKTDPIVAVETLRQKVQSLAREDKQGSRFLISEGIKFMENAIPDRADAELRRFFNDRDSSPYLRAVVSGRLAQRGDVGPVQAFLEEAARGPLKSPDAKERLKAVVNVAFTETPTATPYLLDMMGDPDFLVRARATEGLGFTGGPEAEAALEKLQNDPTPAVRDAAQRATERMQSAFLRR